MALHCVLKEWGKAGDIPRGRHPRCNEQPQTAVE
nr:MAG TPA_asm: hypothetical protein [Caudoviricetes sp.]DAP60985.1 MAG TPA: hypothetical protein [Caudoviricetes sp.]